MNILILGPGDHTIENHLLTLNHSLTVTRELIDVSQLKDQSYDFGISYRYKHIIKPSVIKWFQGRLINLHISYLPWNRGADPNLWSFLTNTPSGVSIHQIDKGLDTGPILKQEKVTHHDPKRDTLQSTYETLSRRIIKLFIENCQELLTEKMTPRPQVGAGSFHRSLDKNKYDYLWAQLGWATPVEFLLGKALPQAK
jgi:methionyl-tRNA formyltransferase